MIFNTHHVAYTVSNISKAVSFYKKLGFKIIYDYSDDIIEICHIANKDNHTIELFFYKKNNSKPKQNDFYENLENLGIQHLALLVENIENAYDYIVNHNINVLSPIKVGRIGIKYFFISDDDFNPIEIVEDKRNQSISS